VRLIVLASALGLACSSGARNAPVTATPPPPPSPDAAVAEPARSAEETSIERARALLALLVAGKHDEAAATFDAKMASVLPADKLAATWQTVEQQAGAFGAVEGARAEGEGSTTAVLTVAFARARLDMRVSFDAAGKVRGLFFAPAAAKEVPYVEPPYVDRGKLEEREVVVGEGGEWALPATLTLPVGQGAGPFRAVVLVHGSGPNNRDETIGANRPFKDLALGLASRGVAVLRYDKRTLVHGAKVARMDDATLDHETVDDAIAAVELLRGMKDIDPGHIAVVGHSLGGFAAPRIAAKGGKRVAGIAILAGSTRPVVDMMIEQLEYIATVDERQAPAIPTAVAEVKRAADRIRQLQRGAKPTPAERVLGAGAAYWRDLGKYDAPATAKKLAIPMFIAQGGRDYQVTRVDFAAWQKALGRRKNATLKLYPELDHLFAAGEGKSSPRDYDERRPVDVRLIDDLAAWVRSL
jgi:uncharacterized protein